MASQRSRTGLIALAIVVVGGLAGVALWQRNTTTLSNDEFVESLPKDDAGNPILPDEVVRDVTLQDDFDGAKVEKSDLLQGCFGKDCIPSIDEPVFESVDEADTWLEPDDRVFAVEYKGEARAYPQRILNWHEIVNDTIAGDPIAITFCPLCGSAVAFERKVDGVVTELGVSGKLHNNDLVMYDRYEGNLWQQITGEGIVGPAARRSEVLEQVPIVTLEWELWKQEHPDTVVLSRSTGHVRDYGQYPYGTYEQDDELLFGIEGLNRELQIKTPVLGIEVEGGSRAYPESLFGGEPRTITDTIANTTVRLESNAAGEVTITNADTGEELIPIRLFWFAWAAFHPDTTIYSE